MSDNKCSNCELVNFPSDVVCRRCGNAVGTYRATGHRAQKSGSSARSWLYTLLAFTLIGSAVYYILSGFERSYDQVQTAETTRIAQQPRNQLVETRSQFEKRQTGTYGNAIKNSNGLNQSQQHVQDIEKLTR